jgi:acyl-CoA hydrolase
MEAKRVSDSAVTMCVQMLPSDANPQGQVHGGTIMKHVDTAAAVVGHRHARSAVATARIDEMSFLAPVEVGDMVMLKASVNAVWRTSMEVGVRVETENLLTGKITHTSSAYLVIVALDEHRRPREVPPLIAETPEERQRLEEAQIRRARRIAAREHGNGR